MDFPPVYADCRRLMRRRDPAFALAARRLPAHLRPGLHALYAYGRIADDLADDPRPGRLAALDAWEAQLDAPQHPVAVALADAGERHRLPLHELHGYLEALRQDCAPVHMRSWSELDAYTDRAAGTFGRLIATLFDVPEHLRRDYGRLGSAFQLVNHLRDVREDRALGQVYLPVAAPDNDDELRVVVADGIARARARFVACHAAVETAPAAVRPAMRVARATHEQVLDRIEATGYDVMGRRTRAARWRVAAAAAAALRP